jgi:hypothetical protein
MKSYTLSWIHRGEGFQSHYIRNNKASGIKNVRCFPQCSDGIHNPNGACGGPIEVLMRATDGHNLDLGKFVAYAELSTNTFFPRYQPGIVTTMSNLLPLVRRKSEPLLPLHFAESEQPYGNGSETNIVFSFNRGQKGHTANRGWHYGWKSSKHKATELHVVRVYVFEVGSPNSVQCVSSIESTAFKVTSSRRRPEAKEAKAAKAALAAQAQSRHHMEVILGTGASACGSTTNHLGSTVSLGEQLLTMQGPPTSMSLKRSAIDMLTAGRLNTAALPHAGMDLSMQMQFEYQRQMRILQNTALMPNTAAGAAAAAACQQQQQPLKRFRIEAKSAPSVSMASFASLSPAPLPSFRATPIESSLVSSWCENSTVPTSLFSKPKHAGVFEQTLASIPGGMSNASANLALEQLAWLSDHLVQQNSKAAAPQRLATSIPSLINSTLLQTETELAELRAHVDREAWAQIETAQPFVKREAVEKCMPEAAGTATGAGTTAGTAATAAAGMETTSLPAPAAAAGMRTASTPAAPAPAPAPPATATAPVPVPGGGAFTFGAPAAGTAAAPAGMAMTGEVGVDASMGIGLAAGAAQVQVQV